MKRFTAIILAFILAILLPFTASAATPARFENELTSLTNYIQQSGQLDNKSVNALARDGALTATNREAFIKQLQEQVSKEQEQDTLKGNKLASIIIALRALNQNPEKFYGLNLINKLSEDTSFSSVYDYIYSLIALTSLDTKLPSNAINTPDTLIHELLLRESSSLTVPKLYGWGYSQTPDVDATGMALAALAPYRNQPDVQKAIDKAVYYLEKSELPMGDFTDGYEENSDTTTQAVIGLTSVGVDPTSEPFNKNGKNPLNSLFTYKIGNGYKWMLSDSQESPYSNIDVLQAFVAYKAFLSGGKLFVFPAAPASAPVVKTPAPNQPQQTTEQGMKPAGESTTTKTATVKVAAKPSQPASASKAATKLASAESPAAQQPVSGNAASTTAAAPETSALSGSPAAVSAKKQTPEKHRTSKKSAVKQSASKQASASGAKKNTPQTKAVQSTGVNPAILIAGIIVIVLGATALIFRKAIWRRHA
jgi:Predicted solute binding protein